MKLSRALLLIALPAGLAAQQPTPAPANPIATAFKNRTAGARRNVTAALEAFPESKYGYKPTPAQLSVGYIAQHVAEDDYFFCNNLTDAKATLPEKDTTTPDSVKATWPKDTLMAKLKAANAFCDDVFSKLDDASISSIITIPGRDKSPARQVSRINYALGHAMDLSDHYSQLANYMRLNDMLPPTAKKP